MKTSRLLLMAGLTFMTLSLSACGGGSGGSGGSDDPDDRDSTTNGDPVLTISEPSGDYSPGDQVSIPYSVSDPDGDEVEVTAEYTSETYGDYSISVGSNTLSLTVPDIITSNITLGISVTASDNIDIDNKRISLNIVVDVNPPSVSFNSASSEIITGETASLGFTVNSGDFPENELKFSYELSGSENLGTASINRDRETLEFSSKSNMIEQKQITITLKVSSGNYSGTDTHSITINPIREEVLAFREDVQDLRGFLNASRYGSEEIELAKFITETAQATGAMTPDEAAQVKADVLYAYEIDYPSASDSLEAFEQWLDDPNVDDSIINDFHQFKNDLLKTYGAQAVNEINSTIGTSGLPISTLDDIEIVENESGFSRYIGNTAYGDFSSSVPNWNASHSYLRVLSASCALECN